MTCEDFQMADLDSGLTAEEGPLQQAARQHLLECPHCAALHENWQVLRTDLRPWRRNSGSGSARSRGTAPSAGISHQTQDPEEAANSSGCSVGVSRSRGGGVRDYVV